MSHVTTKTNVKTLAELDHLVVGDVVSIKGFGDAPADTATVEWVGDADTAEAEGKLDIMLILIGGISPEDPVVTITAGGDHPTVPVAILKKAYQREAKRA